MLKMADFFEFLTIDVSMAALILIRFHLDITLVLYHLFQSISSGSYFSYSIHFEAYILQHGNIKNSWHSFTFHCFKSHVNDCFGPLNIIIFPFEIWLHWNIQYDWSWVYSSTYGFELYIGNTSQGVQSFEYLIFLK